MSILPLFKFFKSTNKSVYNLLKEIKLSSSKGEFELRDLINEEILNSKD